MPMKGAKKHLARLKKLQSPAAMRELGKTLFVGGDIIKAEAQHLITAGAISGKGHVPSRPGEPPNEDSGVLRINIETTQPKPLLVEVSSNAPYAAPLEFGTSTMAQRPYMRPARDNKAEEVRALFAGAVKRLVKASG